MKDIIVIPAYNEKQRIRDVLSKSVAFADKIIVVDDGSTDKTENYAGGISEKIIIVRHKVNLGKGAAMKTGCQAALRLGADRIILMDADGQHQPEDIPRFFQKMEEGNLDVVFGSRAIGKNMPFAMTIGNKFLSAASSILFGVYISDTQSGFRVFRARVYPKLAWNSVRYSVETEMIANIGKYHLKFGEIKIKTIYHDRYKGTTVFDGLRIFINMLIWKII
ncbi:MAG: glycosyltransferase family 2 protein [Patescibacteria group bacterium]